MMKNVEHSQSIMALRLILCVFVSVRCVSAPFGKPEQRLLQLRGSWEWGYTLRTKQWCQKISASWESSAATFGILWNISSHPGIYTSWEKKHQLFYTWPWAVPSWKKSKCNYLHTKIHWGNHCFNIKDLIWLQVFQNNQDGQKSIWIW